MARIAPGRRRGRGFLGQRRDPGHTEQTVGLVCAQALLGLAPGHRARRERQQHHEFVRGEPEARRHGLERGEGKPLAQPLSQRVEARGPPAQHAPAPEAVDDSPSRHRSSRHMASMIRQMTVRGTTGIFAGGVGYLAAW